jgi:hypothetical protein
MQGLPLLLKRILISQLEKQQRKAVDEARMNIERLKELGK